MSTLVLKLENDQEIIREYTERGSERAATAFVRKHQKFVYATALRYLKNEADADDAAQEVFIKALNNLKKFRGDSNIKTWLYRITYNVCSNMARKRKFLSFFTSSDDEKEAFYNFKSDSLTPDRELESREFEQQFLDSIETLPEKQRETFALRYFEEMPYEDISKMLGTSVGGLKANYYQAIRKIAKSLGNNIENK